MIVGIGFVGNLGYLLLVCSAVGALAYILKQPIILGFLIAGIYSLALSAHLASSDTEMLNNFSDLAIVLLLFGVGLSFPLKQLGAIGRIGRQHSRDRGSRDVRVGFAVGSAHG